MKCVYYDRRQEKWNPHNKSPSLDQPYFSYKRLKPELRLLGFQQTDCSSPYLENISANLLKYIHEKTNREIPVIASGGIFNGEDAKEKFDAGAALVQVWTGFIYEGPSIVKDICSNLPLPSQKL